MKTHSFTEGELRHKFEVHTHNAALASNLVNSNGLFTIHQGKDCLMISPSHPYYQELKFLISKIAEDHIGRKHAFRELLQGRELPANVFDLITEGD